MFYTNKNCVDIYILLRNWKCILFHFISIHFSIDSPNHFSCKGLCFFCFVFCILTCIHSLLGLTSFNGIDWQTKSVAISFSFTPTNFFPCSHFDLLFFPLEFSAIFCHFLEHAGTMAWNGSLTFFCFPLRNQTFSQLLNCAPVALKGN